MQHVYPSTVLRNDPSEVKCAACDGDVILTDTGGAQYLFATETAYAAALERAEEESAYAERMARGIRRVRHGIGRGEFVVGARAAIEEAERRRVRG